MRGFETCAGKCLSLFSAFQTLVMNDKRSCRSERASGNRHRDLRLCGRHSGQRYGHRLLPGGFLRVARDSLRAAATPSWQMYDTATNRLSGTANASVVRRELFANVDYFDFENCDSQSCKTTNAELSPGVIDGITKRLPSE